MIYDLSEFSGVATTPTVPQCVSGESSVHRCGGRHRLLLVHHGMVCLYWDGELLTVCSAGEWVLCRDHARGKVCPYADTARYCSLAYGGQDQGHRPPEGRCLFAEDSERIYFRGRITRSLRSSVRLLCTSQDEPHLSDICFRNETTWRVLGAITGEVQGKLNGRSADTLILTDAERLRLEEMRRFLETNPGEECKFCELCDRFSLKTSKVKCSFKACYGETVYSYWKGVKLDHARRMLESGTCNVTEAALAVGYDNPSHFASAFRKRFGIPPKRYQTRHLRTEADC